MVANAVVRAEDRADHARRQFRLALQRLFARENLRGCAEGRLGDRRGLHAAHHLVLAVTIGDIVNLETACPAVPNPTLEFLLVNAPELLRESADRQLAHIAAVGAHAPLTGAAGGAARDLAGFEQRDRLSRHGKLIGEAGAIDAAPDDDDFGRVGLIGHCSIYLLVG